MKQIRSSRLAARSSRSLRLNVQNIQAVQRTASSLQVRCDDVGLLGLVDKDVPPFLSESPHFILVRSIFGLVTHSFIFQVSNAVRSSASALFSLPNPPTSLLSLPGSTKQPWFAKDEENILRLDMENGMCMIKRRYSPEYIRQTSLAKPWDLFVVGARATKMVTLLGGFFLGLQLDKIAGTADTPEQVR